MSVKDLNNETVEKIVNSSILLFNEYGYEGTSISDISKKTEMSRGILYHYFKDKDSLYLYCAEKCIDEFRIYLKTNSVKLNKGKETALELLNLQQNFLKSHPQYRVLCYNALAQRPPHLSNELLDITKSLKNETALAFENAFKDVNFGKGVSVKDAINFLTLLQNNAVSSLDILSNVNNINEQGEAIFRIATIFINGLEQDYENM